MTAGVEAPLPPANVIGPIKVNPRSVSSSGGLRRCSMSDMGAPLSSAFPQVRRVPGEPLARWVGEPAGRKNASECTHRVLFLTVNNGRVSISASK